MGKEVEIFFVTIVILRNCPVITNDHHGNTFSLL